MTTDTERLDWIEKNIVTLTHDIATHSVDMSGDKVTLHCFNPSKNTGRSTVRIRAPNIRAAIDKAMNLKDPT